MGRPSKSTEVLASEGRSHRTKGELAERQEAERAALTGIEMREPDEVKKDAAAHTEWLRVSGLLATVGKNDALYEAVIADYCLAKSDVLRYRAMEEQVMADETIPTADKIKLTLECDKMIEKFRKKRFDIEKENGMTIASSARSIPKKSTKEKNALLEILNGE